MNIYEKMSNVGDIIHYALVPIDLVSYHQIRPSILAKIIYCEKGVMNYSPYLTW